MAEQENTAGQLDAGERQRAEELLGRSERLLRLVIDTLPVGLAVVDGKGDIVLANAAISAIWGRAIASGDERYRLSKAWSHDTGRPIAAEEWASQRALALGRTTLNELIEIETFDGKRKIIQNSAAPIRDERQAIVGAVFVNEDVTDRVRAEEALRKSRQLLLEAETLGHTGSWEMDLRTGEIVNTEENLRLFFGSDRTRGASFGDYSAAVHPDDREWVLERRRQMLEERGPADIEYRVVWPDGSVHVIFGRATIVRDADGKPIRLYGTNADMTERKRAEQDLERHARQLQALSHQLIQAQEAERRAIARELHDDFGQVLTAIKLNLARRDADQEETISLVDGAIARMRELAQDLRPPLLDELGLAASLRWYVEREARRAGLEFHVNLSPPDRRPSPTVETTAFRIAQEALTNAIRHAGATTVEVELGVEGERLRLVVRDDGKSFDVAAAFKRAARGGSQGLLGMKERVVLAGGELQIESSPGKGTAIRASLPLGRAP